MAVTVQILRIDISDILTSGPSLLCGDSVITRLRHEGPVPDGGDDVVGHVEHLEGLVELEAVVNGGDSGPVMRQITEYWVKLDRC